MSRLPEEGGRLNAYLYQKMRFKSTAFVGADAEPSPYYADHH